MTTRRLATHAARRFALAAFIRALGVCLSISLGAALLATLTDRLIGPGIVWWLIPAGLGVIGVIASVFWALRAMPSPLVAASRVDSAMGLKDALASAIALEPSAEDDPFARMAIGDAESLAPRINVRSAIPLRAGNAHVLWPALAAAALAIGYFVPSQHLLTDTKAQLARQQADESQQAAAADVEAAMESLEQVAKDIPADPASEALAQQQRQTLEQLQAELAKPGADADEARAKAAEALDSTAKELARNAEKDSLADTAVRDLFSDLQSGASAEQQPGELSQLSEALKKGDLGKAVEALNNLEDRLDRLPQSEREKIAGKLEEMARELEKLADTKAAEQAIAEAQQREQLEEQGVAPERSEQLAAETDADAAEQKLQEEGLDQEAARKAAEDLAQQNKEDQAQQDAAQDAKDLSESMQDAAQEIREPTPPQPPSPPQSTPSSTDQQPQPQKPAENPPPDSQPPQQQQSPSAPQQQQQQQSQQNESKTQQQQQEQQSQREQNAQSEQRESQQQTQQREGGQQQQNQQQSQQQQQGQPQPQQNDQQQQQQSQGQSQQQGQQQQPPDGQSQRQPGAQQQPTAQPANTPQGTQHSQTDPKEGQQGQQQQSQQARGQKPQQQPGGDSKPQQGNARQRGQMNDPQGQGSGIGEMRQKLEELAQRPQSAQEQAQRAQDLRKQAREMLDRMSPEDRQQLERWAAAQNAERDGKAPPPQLGAEPSDLTANTEPLDLRQDDPDATPQVIAQTNNPNAPAPESGAAPGITNAQIEGELREAMKSAQQAVEERQLPRGRYRNVEKYFRGTIDKLKQSPKP